MQVNGRDFIKENFQCFKDAFTSEQEMLDYWKKFSIVSKPNGSSLEEFYDIALFYKAMKLTKDDSTKLIMITSIIEKLNSENDYRTFAEWINEQKIEVGRNKKDIKRLWSAYNDQFGCSSKFRNFFKGKYLTKKEKVTLLQSVKFYVERDSKSPYLMPMFCYDKNYCYFRNTLSSCPISLSNFDKDDCPICSDDKKLKKGLGELAEFLYYMRNKFVHDACLPRLAPPLKPVKHKDGATLTMTTFNYVHYKFKRKKPEYVGWICVELNVMDIEQILNRNFKNLLENYVSSRKSKFFVE
jgi:hypothetical protein